MTRENLIAEVGAYHKPLQHYLSEMSNIHLLRLAHPRYREISVRAMYKAGNLTKREAKLFINMQEYD